MTRSTPHAIGSCALLLALLPITPSAASEAIPAASHVDAPGSRTALKLGAAAVGTVFLASQLDGWMADEAPEQNSQGFRQVSTTAEKFGHPLYIGAGLALAAGVGPLIGREEWTGSALRIGGGVAAAAAASGIIKLAVGRSRPSETPGDADEIAPFSGHSSFPSGHTTVAFALAAGLDAESDASWVPFVAYPAAALVGWSRLRDNRHWASDVAAGALLGTLVSRHVVHFEQNLGRPGIQSLGVHLDRVGPEGGRRPAVGVEVRF